ncbi:MAG: UvrD-helicase domain-containing protein [Bacteroidia bacterium]|nr:UvrD-helicase domain-containing protein [Bacteroidia bacterium]
MEYLYLKELNEPQRAAVENTDGPVMVIAGAGSGKTRVLTYRIAHLINKGIDPFNILALTFTNKAAREMKERIIKIVGAEAKNLWMGTFHSVFSRILRAEAHLLGYPSNFTIYDTDDSKSLLKSILTEQGLDDKIYKPGVVLNRISSAKNNLISVSAYFNNVEIVNEDRLAGKPKMGLLYQLYNQRLRAASAMDFDDLLFNTNVLLRDHPEILLKYQHRFQYILVDEYQDTNYSQYLIVKKLAALRENLCVVGDDAQSIYAFRGANIQNILNFKKDYPDFKTFKLEQNYRSTKVIVNAANNIIVNNKEQIKKEVWTNNEEGEKIKVIKAYTDNEEGNLVAQSIFETQQNKQLQPNQFAVLYRTNAQSRAFEEAFRKLNIPYKIYGGVSFYQRKEIKDLLSYFRLTINPNDEEALKRVINYPARGIGKTTLDKLIVSATNQSLSIMQVIANGSLAMNGFNSGTILKLNEFKALIDSFSTQLKSKNAYDLASHLAQVSGVLKDLYTDKTPEGVSRYENIQELLNGIKEFTEKPIPTEDGEQKMLMLDEFMSDVALLTGTESEDENDNNKVSLMTVHSAKGLEFPYVYIVGVEENLFPSQMSLGSREELEEERRLFYVALTRAGTQVSITYSETRYRWGNLIYCEPSRFIDEIDDEYLLQLTPPSSKKNHSADNDFEQYTGWDKRSNKTFTFKAPASAAQKPTPKNLVKIPSVSTQTSSTQTPTEPITDIIIGMRVEHQRFGVGTVKLIEGRAPQLKATVTFDQGGDKQLLLQYAKLKVL